MRAIWWRSVQLASYKDDERTLKYLVYFSSTFCTQMGFETAIGAN